MTKLSKLFSFRGSREVISNSKDGLLQPESTEDNDFGTPTSVEVYWDGAIKATYLDPQKRNYVIRRDIGKAASSTLEAIKPFFDAQRARYAGERLVTGALVFDVSETGEIALTVDAPDVRVIGESPRPNGIAHREGGGVSFHNENLAELGISPLLRPQQIGSTVIELTQIAQPEEPHS